MENCKNLLVHTATIKMPNNTKEKFIFVDLDTKHEKSSTINKEFNKPGQSKFKYIIITDMQDQLTTVSLQDVSFINNFIKASLPYI